MFRELCCCCGCKTSQAIFCYISSFAASYSFSKIKRKPRETRVCLYYFMNLQVWFDSIRYFRIVNYFELKWDWLVSRYLGEIVNLLYEKLIFDESIMYYSKSLFKNCRLKNNASYRVEHWAPPTTVLQYSHCTQPTSCLLSIQSRFVSTHSVRRTQHTR